MRAGTFPCQVRQHILSFETALRQARTYRYSLYGEGGPVRVQYKDGQALERGANMCSER